MALSSTPAPVMPAAERRGSGGLPARAAIEPPEVGEEKAITPARSERREPTPHSALGALPRGQRPASPTTVRKRDDQAVNSLAGPRIGGTLGGGRPIGACRWGVARELAWAGGSHDDMEVQIRRQLHRQLLPGRYTSRCDVLPCCRDGRSERCFGDLEQAEIRSCLAHRARATSGPRQLQQPRRCTGFTFARGRGRARRYHPAHGLPR